MTTCRDFETETDGTSDRLSGLTFSPLSLDTCLLSVMSHLLPKIIFSTSDEACCEKLRGVK